MLRRELDSDLDDPGEEDNINEEEGRAHINGTMKASNRDLEAEYPDEDRYTTVTVEAVEVSRDGLHKTPEDEVLESDGEGVQEVTPQSKSASRRSGGTPLHSKAKSLDPKRKRKKFKYESKTERKMTRHKERSKNSARAKDRRSK